ncbi:DUF4440 domain-containing protein [Phytoactinopolyspora halotolerans]|uniref:DUF4440 domain-containing protein n=1 Tax=Phytoactinopolyspora halotolerans TaxID=1981512 RepID=A0A6L9S9N5_9ACTN|nr:DUF4440 domain-containing protein [Phytoactinopolyspora halotolerans]NEE01946.1 DUF4440 domain-containing protein [Phytoactinopolyspora halotolerans]
MTVMTDEQAVQDEVVRLHRIIQRWLSGRATPDDPDFDAFCAAQGAGFTLVMPEGRTLHREDVLEMVRAAHGVEPAIEIRIHDVTVVAADADVVVATYREEHRGTAAEHIERLATAVFTRDGDTPHGLRWRHLHETWATVP